MLLHPNHPQQGLDKKAIVIEFKENFNGKILVYQVLLTQTFEINMYRSTEEINM